MKATSKTDDFQVRRVTARERGYSYDTYRLDGYLGGERVRRRFRTLDEALGEKSRLTVQAANTVGEIQPINTRLSRDEVAEAEVAFRRLAGKSLNAAVDWYLNTYKPPVTAMALERAMEAFVAEKKPHLRKLSLRDYQCTLRSLCAAFPGRDVGTITTQEIQQFLAARHVGKKRFNNLRGDLHAFFAWCQSLPREWAEKNPVTPIQKFRVSRDVPEIISTQLAKELMAYVECYSGGPKKELAQGSLVPYFALCLFAGLRPSVPDGEIMKLAELPDPSKVIKLDLGVIQVTREMAKTKDTRQVQIQPNLSAWLTRYPLSEYPIFVPNLQRHVAAIRKKFDLGDDVLRHTFISMHVAKFKSRGAAALEAGNSEKMISKHYLNMVTESDADTFWGIVPQLEPPSSKST